MLLFDYTRVLPFLACLLVFGLGLLCWHLVYRRKKVARIPGQIASIVLIGASTLLFLMYGCGELWDGTTYSRPIYSPDGKKAIEVKMVSGGAFGGWMNVILFSNHGLLVSTILIGDWGQASLQHMRWIDDHNLQIEYDAEWRHPPECSSTRQVTVLCKAVPASSLKEQP